MFIYGQILLGSLTIMGKGFFTGGGRWRFKVFEESPTPHPPRNSRDSLNFYLPRGKCICLLCLYPKSVAIFSVVKKEALRGLSTFCDAG